MSKRSFDHLFDYNKPAGRAAPQAAEPYWDALVEEARHIREANKGGYLARLVSDLRSEEDEILESKEMNDVQKVARLQAIRWLAERIERDLKRTEEM